MKEKLKQERGEKKLKLEGERNELQASGIGVRE